MSADVLHIDRYAHHRHERTLRGVDADVIVLPMLVARCRDLDARLDRICGKYEDQNR
jgi:hypothetical protein